MPYPIKKLWEITILITKWSTPTSYWFKYLNSWVSFIKIENISNWKIIKDSIHCFISEEANIFQKRSILNEWDLLISIAWTIWTVAVVNNNILPANTNQALAIVRWYNQYTTSNYLQFVLSSNLSKDFKDKARWGALQNISLEDIKNIPIPLPPLPTQKLIVQKLDESFEKIDKSIEITKKNLENLEQLNKSVLEEVFKKWEYDIKTIDDISHNVQYWYTWKTIEKWNYKYLRITDIQDNNIIWANVPYVDITEKESNKYKLNKWDIVFARTWATVWKSCLIDEVWVGNVFASYLIRIIWKQNLVNPNFMQYFFYSKNYWEQIWLDVVWAAQPNFNWTKLKQVKIPLPPLPKQKEIVTYLDQIFEKNKSLKSEYERKLKDLEELKQSLLKEAFEWKLVKE